MPEISDRIKQLRNYLSAKTGNDWSETKFAETVGIKPNSFNYSVNKSEGGPNLQDLTKILVAYPEISPDWLILGKGPMLRDAGTSILNEPQQQYINTDIDLSSKKKIVRLERKHVEQEIIVATQDLSGNNTVAVINYKAAANFKNGYGSQEFFEKQPGMIMPSIFVKKGKQYCSLQVAGDSMHPTIYNNDWVICRFIEKAEWGTIKDNYIYVLVSKLRGTDVKRVLNRLEEKQHLWCKSDNKAHRPYEIQYDDLIQVWQVEWRLSNYLADVNETLYGKVNRFEEELEFIKKHLGINDILNGEAPEG